MNKSYQCPLCWISFGTEDFLHCHYRDVHDKKFKCTICDYRSNRKYDVLRHERLMHKNDGLLKNEYKSNQLMGSSQMRVDSDDNDTLYVSDEDDSDIKDDSEAEEENNVPYISDEDESEEENDSPYVSDEKTDDNVTLKRRIKTLNHIINLYLNLTYIILN